MIKFLDIKKTPVKICFYFLIITGFFIFFNNLAIASNIDQSILGDITQKYKNIGSTWGDNIKTHALWLLKWMLVIQLTVMAVKLGFKQSTLQDVIEDLVMVTIFGGIFWALIIKGQSWGINLINGMVDMAQDVAGGGSPPSEAFFAKIFNDTLKIADKHMDKINSILRK